MEIPAAVAALPFWQQIIGAIVLFVMFIVYNAVVKKDLYIKMSEIKSKHKAILWSYISNELTIIKSISMNNTSNILDEIQLNKCPECGNDEKQKQLSMFSFVLDKILFFAIFNEIKTAIRINGFMKMDKPQLDAYILDKATYLLSKARGAIGESYYLYPLLRNTDDQRFALSASIEFFTSIINKSIQVKKDEELELKVLQKEYSFLSKINIVKKLLDKYAAK